MAQAGLTVAVLNPELRARLLREKRTPQKTSNQGAAGERPDGEEDKLDKMRLLEQAEEMMTGTRVRPRVTV